MGRQTGYSKLTCDRCGRTAFLQSVNAGAQSWYDVNHLTSTSAASAQPPSTYTLCGDCYKAFQSFAATADAEFEKWVKDADREEQS